MDSTSTPAPEPLYWQVWHETNAELDPRRRRPGLGHMLHHSGLPCIDEIARQKQIETSQDCDITRLKDA